MIKRINEVFPDWTDNGIFETLNTFDVPWKNFVNPKELDIAYHGGHSGEKIISPLVDKLISNDELTDASKMLLSSSIMAVYGRNWGKLWDTLTFDYNPIENYNMTETEQTDISISSNTTLEESENVNGTNTLNDTGTVNKNTENETTNTTNNANNIYGFNSSSPVGADNQIGTTTGSNSGTDNETRNLKTESIVESTTSTDSTSTNTGSTLNNRTLSRTGNIGVTTTQQMIQSEREVWNWYFFDIVFRDIDKMLTLSIY